MRRAVTACAVLAAGLTLAACGGSGGSAQSLQDRQAAQACAQVTAASTAQGLDRQVDMRHAAQYAQMAAQDPKYAPLATAIVAEASAQPQDEINGVALDTTAGGHCPV